MCIVKYCISMISHDKLFGKIRATPQKEILGAHAHLLKRSRATWSEKALDQTHRVVNSVWSDEIVLQAILMQKFLICFLQHETQNSKTSTNSSGTTYDSTSTAAPEININQWLEYIDPITSLLLMIVMTTKAWLPIKHSSLILLQTVPQHIKLETIKDK